MANKTIWYDITPIKDWTGAPSGIQRVLFSLLSEFKNSKNYNVKYCYFDESTLSFKEINEHQKPTTTAKNSEQETSKKQVISLIKKVIPVPVKNKIKAVLINFKKTKQSFPIIQESSCIFSQNDTLLTFYIRLNNNDNYFDTIKKHKKEKGIRVSSMIYDLIPIKFPHFYPNQNFGILFKRWLNNIISTSDKIYSISDSTKNDCIEYCKATNQVHPPIETIRLGDDIPENTNDSLSDSLKEEIKNRDFIIFASSFEPRKNHYTLYKTWKILKRRLQEKTPLLILVGSGSWLSDEVTHFIKLDPETSNDIKIFRGLSDKDLNSLYKNAIFSVYPSLYEGWGLPIAESLNHGVFCLSANTSSMPEVGREFCEYFDPENHYELAEKIIKYLDDKKLLMEKTNLIKSKYKPASWKSLANTIHEQSI